MRRVLHIDRSALAENRKDGGDRPVVELLVDGTTAARFDDVELVVDGTVVARVLYRPQMPLPSGASCWVEIADGTDLRVRG